MERPFGGWFLGSKVSTGVLFFFVGDYPLMLGLVGLMVPWGKGLGVWLVVEKLSTGGNKVIYI